MGPVVAVGAVVVVLLVVAALHDWHARRTGQAHRATRAYWDAVREARRAERNERATHSLLRSSLPSRSAPPRRRRL